MGMGMLQICKIALLADYYVLLIKKESENEAKRYQQACCPEAKMSLAKSMREDLRWY
jgi:hypothetical protein